MTGTGNATPPRPGTKPAPSRVTREGTSLRGSGTFAWCTPKGHSAPFPIYAAARDGFARANADRRVATLFDCAGGARLSESGNWQLACDGRGEVLHWCTPLSQPVRYSARPATSVRALAPPRPRGCATTTRRPRSRRRPRIGAGWDPVTKSINTIKLPPAHVSDRRTTSSLCL